MNQGLPLQTKTAGPLPPATAAPPPPTKPAELLPAASLPSHQQLLDVPRPYLKRTSGDKETRSGMLDLHKLLGTPITVPLSTVMAHLPPTWWHDQASHSQKGSRAQLSSLQGEASTTSVPAVVTVASALASNTNSPPADEVSTLGKPWVGLN